MYAGGGISEKTDKNGIALPILETVPLGECQPEGWLKTQLSLTAEGYFSHMTDISRFLTDRNGWLCPEMENTMNDYQQVGWEEQAYWLRGAYKLALLTGNERLVRDSNRYIEALFAFANEDGYFGPMCLKTTESKNGPMPDLWPHMVMADVMKDYYIATGDKRAIDLLTNFCHYFLALPDEIFLPEETVPESGYGGVQTTRSCDMVPVIWWLYSITGDESLPRLAERIFNVWKRDPWELFDDHGVNFAMRWRYQASNYPISLDKGQIEAAEKLYSEHMKKWGQMPGGLYAADERTREGKHDPRQGSETCTLSELVKNFSYMAQLTGDPLYADRIEDIMFNSYPAAHTPDCTGLHYITAANQPELDAKNHDYHNEGMWTRYSAFAYRCCQHNSGMSWPNFIASLFMRNMEAPELYAWTYAPCTLDTVVGGVRVKLKESTEYPFRNKITFAVEAAEAAFTLCLRVPGWCKRYTVCVNGESLTADGDGNVLRLEKVNAGDRIEVIFEQQISLRHFPLNGNCVCVDRGPLTYSLKLKEKWTRADVHTDRAGKEWYDWDVAAVSPFNYALDLSCPITVKQEAEVVPDQPFTADNAPITLEATGVRVPGWGIGEDNTIMPVPQSPMVLDGPRETVELAPLGCQRVRMSCLPYTE